jgi:prepilin-type N-terminal cleavage/methylation domain-containing protein
MMPKPAPVRGPGLGQTGFSIIELLVGLAIVLLVSAAAFAVLKPSQSRFATELEAVDMEQRLRVAADTLRRDLLMAGSGVGAPGPAGPLTFWFPPVLPFRQGAVADDPPGTFKSDTITLFHVPTSAARSTLTAPLGPGQLLLKVAGHSGCPSGGSLCGFSAGMPVVVYDDFGAYDTFTVTAVNDDVGSLGVNRPAGAMETTFKAGSHVAEVVQHTYYLKTDPKNGTFQLMRYDGTKNSAVAVADHVVRLRFEYFGEPDPPLVTKAVTEPEGPWTTYGPRPPPPDVQRVPYPPGENCLFTYDQLTNQHLPRLMPVALADQVPLAAPQLTDGPFWCPDVANARRYDADLLRIRSIAVTVRTQSAVPAFRGPAGELFFTGGTSNNAHRYLPDREVRFLVTPRNLALTH